MCCALLHRTECPVLCVIILTIYWWQACISQVTRHSGALASPSVSRQRPGDTVCVHAFPSYSHTIRMLPKPKLSVLKTLSQNPRGLPASTSFRKASLWACCRSCAGIRRRRRTRAEVPCGTGSVRSAHVPMKRTQAAVCRCSRVPAFFDGQTACEGGLHEELIGPAVRPPQSAPVLPPTRGGRKGQASLQQCSTIQTYF